MDAFGKEALDSHNRYRAQHGAAPLTWSSSIAREAETWARRLAREGRMKHADCNDGENIYMCYGRGEVSGADAVDSWYSEVKDYKFSKPGFQSNTGHFTQVVWKESREFGIGKAKSPDGKLFVVGRYRPAGNVLRHFQDNVLPKGAAPQRGKEDRATRRPEPVRSSDRTDHGRTFQPISQNFSAGRPGGNAFAPTKGSKSTARDDDDEFERYRRMFENDPQLAPDARTRAVRKPDEAKDFTDSNDDRQKKNPVSSFTNREPPDTSFRGRASSPRTTADSNEEETVVISEHKPDNTDHVNKAFNRFCYMVENDKEPHINRYCGRTSSPKKTADSNEEELVLASQQNTVNVKHANEAFDRFCRMVENDVDSRKNRGGTYQVKESITTQRGPDGKPQRSYVREVERRYEPTSQRGVDHTRGAGSDKFDSYMNKFDNAANEDSRKYNNRSPLGGEDRGTKQYVTRTRREDGGYEEKTETVTETADGGRRTVVSTVTVNVNQGGSGGTGQRNWMPISTTTRDSSPLSDFSRDMRRDLPNDDRRHGGRSQPSSVSPKTTSGIPVKTSGSSKQDFSKQSLAAHNRYRAAHGVPAMRWSDQMAREAQAWAEKLAKERCLRHASKSERGDCGENIAMFTGKFDEAGDEATTMWYDEVGQYNFRRPGFQSNTGHFTQVVWKDSKELGMGRASTRDGRLTFVVGRYRPAGNVMAHFDNNVYPRTR